MIEKMVDQDRDQEVGIIEEKEIMNKEDLIEIEMRQMIEEKVDKIIKMIIGVSFAAHRIIGKEIVHKVKDKVIFLKLC